MSNFLLGILVAVSLIAIGEGIFILWCHFKEKKDSELEISDEAYKKTMEKSDEKLKSSIFGHLDDDK